MESTVKSSLGFTFTQTSVDAMMKLHEDAERKDLSVILNVFVVDSTGEALVDVAFDPRPSTDAPVDFLSEARFVWYMAPRGRAAILRGVVDVRQNAPTRLLEK
jgi:hypothetical protein